MSKLCNFISTMISIIAFFIMYIYQVSPRSFNNYIEFISGLQQIFIFIFGILLALLGSINIFKEYIFFKKLFQLNGDLQIIKILLKLIFYAGLLILISVFAFLFNYDSNSRFSIIFISGFMSLTIKFKIHLIDISLIFKRLFTGYINSEKREREL